MEEYELRYERAGAVISVNVMELLKAGPAHVRKFFRVVKGQEFTTDPEKLESVNEELEKLYKTTDNGIKTGANVTIERKIYEACKVWLEKPVEHTTKIEVTVKGRFPDGTTEKIVPGYKSESYPGLAYIKNASIIPGTKGWNLTDIESGLRLIEGNGKSDLQYKMTNNVWDIYQKAKKRMIKAGGVATAPADTIETPKPTQVKETKNMITENEKNVKEAEPARIEKPVTSEAPTDNKPVTSEAPDGWEAMALLSLGSDKHNTALIMAAGIEAGVFTFDDFKAFYHAGTMPNYHTFGVWKDNGRAVKKGEKAAFSALIWREIKETDEKAEKADKETAEKAEKYILKKAYFFGEAQTEKASENKDIKTLPDDVTSTIENGYIIISGNTKPIKEQLKAAGYRWNSKKSVWYKYARKVA